MSLLAFVLAGAAMGQDAVPVKPDADPATTIVVHKKAVTKKIDKTVYDTAGDPKAANGTAQDVLQSTPTVSVSPDGGISVQGNHNVTVLVDGKPSEEMSGDDRVIALQTLSGSDIASVEVITNPSAAYNANGGAIINIVLKKDRKPGAHGVMRGSVSDQGLWNVNLSGDHSRGKLSLHGSLGLRRDGTLKFRRSDVAWRVPGTGSYGEDLQSSQVFIRRTTRNAALGLDYDLSDTDRLSASASYNFRRSRPYFDEFDQDYAAGSLSDAYHRISYGPNQQADDSLNLSYNRQTGDTVLKAAIQRSDTDSLVDKSYYNAFLYPVQAPTYAQVTNRTQRHLDQATLDYARPFGEGNQVSLGLDYERDANEVGNRLAAVDPVTGQQTVDMATTHAYGVVETQNAAYVTTQLTWGGAWQALVGARYEAATTRLDPENGAGIAITRYHSLNPSLHLKYAFDDSRSLTFSYRQSLQRPDPHDLDPFVIYGDAQNLYSGNPDLRPQGVKSLELTYDSETGAMTRSLGAFYRRSRDTVVDSRGFTADNVILTTKRNAGSGQSVGVNASFDWKASDALHLSGDASLYEVALETLDLNGPVRQSGLSGQVNLALDYTAGANELSLDAHFDGPGITPQGWHSATNSLNATWKRHLSGRLDLTVQANDLLDGAKQSYSTTTATFSQRGYNHFVVRRVYVGLVCKIG